MRFEANLRVVLRTVIGTLKLYYDSAGFVIYRIMYVTSITWRTFRIQSNIIYLGIESKCKEESDRKKDLSLLQFDVPTFSNFW